MRFENAFAADAPIDDVYVALLDLERVAGCVPGAPALERRGDDTYDLEVSADAGSMSLTARGWIEIADRDPAAHRVAYRATAEETNGLGSLDSQVELRLMPDDGATLGTITADVQLSGMAAVMGRQMIEEMAPPVIETFAQNLTAMLAQRPVEVVVAEAAEAVRAAAEQPAAPIPSPAEPVPVAAAAPPSRFPKQRLLAVAAGMLLGFLVFRRRR
jgi:carbon monoxide dehydrogenase subunit G